MTREIRDWSITASANQTGAIADAVFIENQKYSEVNDAAREMQAQEARWRDQTNATIVPVSNTTGTYQASVALGLGGYKDGDVVMFHAAQTNEGTARFTYVSSATSSPAEIVNHDGSALLESEIVIGGSHRIYYHSGSGKFQVSQSLRWISADNLVEPIASGVVSRLIYDGGISAGVLKRLAPGDWSFVQADDANTHTFSANDLNGIRVYTGSTSTDAWTMNASTGDIGDHITVINNGGSDGPTLTDGTGTISTASGNKVVQQNGVVFLVQVAADEWKGYGDLTA